MGSNTNQSRIVTLTIFLLLISSGISLKHGGKTQTQNTPQPNHTSPAANQISDKPATAITSAQKTTPAENKEAKVQQKQQKVEKDNKQQTTKLEKDQQAKDNQGSENLVFQMKALENQYVVPIRIGSDQYNLGLFYGEQKVGYGKIPSWIFTSLTDAHSLCDAASDCQEVTKFVKCEPANKKDSVPCIDGGKAKYNNQFLQSKKKAKITYKINEKTRSDSFVSPTKATLNYAQISENQISGVLNLATDADKNSNSLILNNKTIRVLGEEQFASQLKTKGIIELSKTGFLSISDNKDIYLRTENKDSKTSNNLKQSYEKIRIGFNRVDVVMAVTKNLMVGIKNILKKEYFGDRCKIKDYQVTCSAPPIQNITKLKLCRDKNGQNCLNLDILELVVKEVKPGKTYQLLIEQNKQNEDESTLIFYPKLAEHYQIYASSGLVKGVLPLKQTSGKKAESAKQQKQESDKEKQKESKSQKSEQNKQDEQKSKNSKHKSNEEQSQQQKSKKKQEQQKSEQNNKNQDKDQDQEQDQDQNQESKTKNKSKTKKGQKQQEQDETEDEQEQKNVKSKSSSKKKPTPKHIQSELAGKGSVEEQQKYSKGILFFTFIYGAIFIAVVVVIKWKAKESVAAAAIDRFLEVTWYAMVKNYFARSQGYNPPTFEQEEPKGNEQVDRSDSVAVGYSYKQGKELFWENNSIEGF